MTDVFNSGVLQSRRFGPDQDWLTPTEQVRNITGCVQSSTLELGANGFVYTECRCGRTDLLTRSILKAMGMKPDERLVGLGKRLRCQRCGEHGRVTISVRRAK